MKVVSALKSRKNAAILGYISIFVSTVLNLVLTRVYLMKLGQDGYGLYQMIYSIAQYMLLLDLGIGTITVKNITERSERKDQKGIENFAFHMSAIILCLIVLVVIVGSILNCSIESIYQNLTAEEYRVSHQMFVFMIISLCFNMIDQYMQGVVISYGYVGIGNFMSIASNLLKFIIVIALIYSGIGVVSIAMTDTIIKTILVITYFVIVFGKLGFRIHFYSVEKPLIVSILSMMVALFLQTIVTFANNTIDKTLLGIMTTKADVAVYSLGISFVTILNMLPTVFVNIFLPSIVKIKERGGSGKEYTDVIIKVGRIQFMACILVLAGFFVCGKDFIAVMYGLDNLDGWRIALIVMIPNIVPLSQSIVNNVLDATNKRMFRSVTLVVMSLGNILLSIVLIQRYGYIGAPIGTAISYILGDIIALNIYYSKRLHLQVKRMLFEIPKRTLLCAVVSAIPSFIISIVIGDNYSVLSFLVKGSFFVVLFVATMLLYGFNGDERGYVRQILNRLRKGNNKYEISES